jgi:hypothetical protein
MEEKPKRTPHRRNLSLQKLAVLLLMAALYVPAAGPAVCIEAMLEPDSIYTSAERLVFAPVVNYALTNRGSFLLNYLSWWYQVGRYIVGERNRLPSF